MAGHQTIKDFILLSEFCEVEGPRCVMTIPTTLPHLNNNEHFNLDEFLLYIMTTDYQNFPGFVLHYWTFFGIISTLIFILEKNGRRYLMCLVFGPT